MSDGGKTLGDALFGWAQATAWVLIVGLLCWVYVQTDGCTTGEIARRQQAMEEQAAEEGRK